MKTTITVTLALLLAVPAVAASHDPGDLACWTLGEALKCYVHDTGSNLDCLRQTDSVSCLVSEQGRDTGTFARRACDALTGQACTQP